MLSVAGSGLAGIALSLVGGCIGGGLLREGRRSELAVGGRGHGSGDAGAEAALVAGVVGLNGLRVGRRASCQARGVGEREPAAERGQATRAGGGGESTAIIYLAVWVEQGCQWYISELIEAV